MTFRAIRTAEVLDEQFVDSVDSRFLFEDLHHHLEHSDHGEAVLASNPAVFTLDLSLVVDGHQLPLRVAKIELQDVLVIEIPIALLVSEYPENLFQ